MSSATASKEVRRRVHLTPGSAEFRLELPPVWNNKFLFEGCGGNCGSVTSTSVNPLDAAEALRLGYAVVNTDTGHEQDPATILLTWAVSDSTPPVVNGRRSSISTIARSTR
jgi:Tannase and feruloyl esterase